MDVSCLKAHFLQRVVVNGKGEGILNVLRELYIEFEILGNISKTREREVVLFAKALTEHG